MSHVASIDIEIVLCKSEGQSPTVSGKLPMDQRGEDEVRFLGSPITLSRKAGRERAVMGACVDLKHCSAISFRCSWSKAPLMHVRRAGMAQSVVP